MSRHRTIAEYLSGRPLVAVAADASVREAVDRMRSARSPSVLALDGERLVGILTDRDVLFRVLAAARDPGSTLVREVMTAHPETLRPEDSVAYSINRMAVGGFRNVPIVDDDGRAVGVIAVGSVLRHLRTVLDDLDPSEWTADDWYDAGGGG